MNPDTQKTSIPLHRNVDFSLLLFAQGLSITGREIGTIVLPLLVLAMTGSAFHVGMIASMQALPYLLLSLPAGALVDRWDRKRVMLICEYIRVIALLTVPTAWLVYELQLLHLYLVAFFTGVAFVFYNVAEIAAIPQIVSKDQLPKAMSATNVVEWSGELTGPAIGGFLVGLAKTTLIGAMLAYLVQGLMQFMSVLSLTAIRQKLEDPQTGSQSSLLADIRGGVSWLVSNSAVRSLALMAMALNFLFGPVTIAIIVLAKNDYAATPEAIGLLFSMAGVVGLGSAIVAPWFHRKFKVGHILVSSVSIWAIGMLVMPASGSFYVLAIGWAIVTAVGGIYDVVATSYRLALIPDAMQGRVNSVFRFIGFGIRPLTLAIGGFMIAAIGARETLWVLALGMLALAIATALGSLRSVE
ncbi:MAG: MFS transporter [Gammaproteobacteria bacterium]|nr:MFS transporter [Gammaproteobacteria bacterium]MBT4494833.1 MFS transporter [Gammaproteobacteria bacterium]